MQPKYVITLVHGTWARKAPWTQEGSFLRSSLEEAIGPVEFMIFPWSGRNMFAARWKASQALRAFLLTTLERHPSSQHYIIAHSHGGNVALQALAEPALASRISGLACISTPFLHMRPRELGGLGNAVEMVLKYLMLPMVFIGIVSAIVGVILGVGYAVSEHLDVDLNGISFGAWNVVWLAIIILTAVILYALSRRVVAQFKEQGLRIFGSVEGDVPLLGTEQLLILQAPGDEAMTALNAVRFVGWLVTKFLRPFVGLSHFAGQMLDWHTKFWDGVMRRRLLAGSAVAGLVLITFVLPEDLRIFPLLALILVFLVGYCLFIVAYVAVLIFLTLGVVGLVFAAILSAIFTPFGIDLALTSLFIEISAESTPRGTWTVHRMGGVEGLMAHSRGYHERDTLTVIAEWITGRARD